MSNGAIKYDVIMNNMTPEKLARILVKPVVVNHDELFYVSSTGQLFPFDNFAGAVEYEINNLMSKVPTGGEQANADEAPVVPLANTESNANADCGEWRKDETCAQGHGITEDDSSTKADDDCDNVG